ncbi:MAG: hypothetical protein ACYC0N_02010, partial [Carboxydocellales bacterium]
MNGEEFKHHCARLGWPPPFAAKQFGRTARTGYAWAAGTRKIPATVASFMETYTDPMAKPPATEPAKSPITPAHLLAYRRHFALSQLQAATLAHVSRVTWNRWERSKSPIPAHV